MKQIKKLFDYVKLYHLTIVLQYFIFSLIELRRASICFNFATLYNIPLLEV